MIYATARLNLIALDTFGETDWDVSFKELAVRLTLLSSYT